MTSVSLSGLRLACPPPQASGAPGVLMIRPEKALLAGEEMQGENCFRGKMVSLKYLGATVEYHVTLAGGERLVARQQQSAGAMALFRSGEQVTVQLPPSALRWLQA